MSQLLKYRKGFSLIESLLFLLVILALTVMLITSAGSLSKTRGVQLDSVASEIASCDLEEVRKLTFNSLSNSSIPIPAPCAADITSKLPAGASGTRTVADITPPDLDIKQVNIYITWTESTEPKNYNLDTLISKYGL